jgi:hypothetical protein
MANNEVSVIQRVTYLLNRQVQNTGLLIVKCVSRIVVYVRNRAY